MTIGKISQEQAKAIAYSLVSVIPDYIKAHKAEYLAYLERTKQVDLTINGVNNENGTEN